MAVVLMVGSSANGSSSIAGAAAAVDFHLERWFDLQARQRNLYLGGGRVESTSGVGGGGTGLLGLLFRQLATSGIPACCRPRDEGEIFHSSEDDIRHLLAALRQSDADQLRSALHNNGQGTRDFSSSCARKMRSPPLSAATGTTGRGPSPASGGRDDEARPASKTVQAVAAGIDRAVAAFAPHVDLASAPG
ncbi:MAG: hypothetical protein U1E61_15705 [Bradyrhizobium sp.]